MAQGLRDFRVELLSESADEAREVIRLYEDLFAGRADGKQVWQRLKASNRVGVTRGRSRSDAIRWRSCDRGPYSSICVILEHGVSGGFEVNSFGRKAFWF